MKKYILVSLVIAFCWSSVLAQNRHTKKADKRFDNLEYVKAVKAYKKLVKRDRATPYVYKRLGDSYYKLHDTKNAALYYGKYLDKAEKEVDGEYYYRYAQLLKSNGKDRESNTYMQKFAQKMPNDSRAKAFKADPDYLSKLENRDQVYKLNKLSIDSKVQDFGAYKHDGKLYFVSARNNSRRTYNWNGQPTLDVYVSEKKAGKYDKPKLLEGDVNTKFHEGSVVITKDNKTMYFTRNDYTDRKYRKSESGIGQLKIYRAKNVNGSWTDITELPFNSSEFSNGHVTLSPDEKTLYFTSDRPGGYGESDIYKVAIEGDGEFGEPKNLGPNINTPAKEDFPFMDEEGTLYFSSEGHLGMGGKDVFKAKAQGNGFAIPVNVGKDVNSRADDYSFSYDPEAEKGFVASNRSGKTSDDATIANDNIYEVVKVKEQRVDIYVKAIDAETGRPVKDVDMSVYNDQNKKLKSKTGDDEGSAQFKNMPGGDHHYAMQLSADGYESAAKEVPHQKEGKINLVVEMQPVKKMITKEKVLLEPIHFEFDKSNITKQGALELDKLVDIMKKHSKMKIHVIAHTDNIGAKAYNQKLSERRAKSTVQYVIDHGIDESRIDGEGVGESDPKVKCTKCTAKQRAENRRSDFVIKNPGELEHLKVDSMNKE